MSAPQNVIDYYTYDHHPSQLYGADRAGGQSRTHRGVDYAHGHGTPVPALVGGVVTALWPDDDNGYRSGYGNRVELRAADGAIISYSHLLALPRLSVGQLVSAGDIVGREGATGWVVGSCMHLEREIDGQRIDPLPYVNHVIRGGSPAANPVEGTEEMIVWLKGRVNKRSGGLWLLRDGVARYLGENGNVIPDNVPVYEDESTIKNIAKYYRGIHN